MDPVYTDVWKARMEMKAGLTFACMNLKKLAKIKAKWGLLEEGEPHKISILYTIRIIREKWLWDNKSQSRFVYSLRRHPEDSGVFLFFPYCLFIQ